MADATLDVVERVLDEVDKSRDVDWTILGERLRSAILDSGEHSLTAVRRNGTI